jgi:hypothetical protein
VNASPLSEDLKLTVVIAAYNEKRTIATVVERVRPVPVRIEVIAGARAVWHIVGLNLSAPAPRTTDLRRTAEVSPTEQ